MMRDSRGRFVNRRTFAAEVLLEVVVETAAKGNNPDRPPVTQMLAEATRCADLLLAGDR